LLEIVMPLMTSLLCASAVTAMPHAPNWLIVQLLIVILLRVDEAIEFIFALGAAQQPFRS
jgi:hypothetical protein